MSFVEKSYDFVWIDLVNDSDLIPKIDADIFVKLLKLDHLNCFYNGLCVNPSLIKDNSNDEVSVYSSEKESNETIYDDEDELFGIDSTTLTQKPQPRNYLDAENRAEKLIENRKRQDTIMQQKKVEEVRKLNELASREQGEFEIAQKALSAKIAAWSGPEGSTKNIRALLGTLHLILWDGAPWKPISVLARPSDVKSAYRKACLIVHTDKVPADSPITHKVIAQRVFDCLQVQYSLFESCELKQK